MPVEVIGPNAGLFSSFLLPPNRLDSISSVNHLGHVDPDSPILVFFAGGQAKTNHRSSLSSGDWPVSTTTCMQIVSS